MVEGILATMRRALLAAVVACAVSPIGLLGQALAVVDTSKLGPQAGSVAPAFTGVDQFGKSHTLASSYGPKGTMLVFFRSADW
jgi:hypothetical protein